MPGVSNTGTGTRSYTISAMVDGRTDRVAGGKSDARGTSHASIAKAVSPGLKKNARTLVNSISEPRTPVKASALDMVMVLRSAVYQNTCQYAVHVAIARQARKRNAKPVPIAMFVC